MANGAPLVPRSKTNPAGQTRGIAKATGAINKHLSSVQKWLLERFSDIPVTRTQLNAQYGQYNVENVTYDYLISIPELQSIVDELMMQMAETPADELVEQVTLSYEAGTATEVANLAAISSDYTREITQVLVSDPYLKRVALVRSRVFELMEGFEGDTGRDLARVLREGIENGDNPLTVADTIRQRFGVSKNRAERIARTEITAAQRRAIWDEDKDANERLGIRTRILWFSALSPTTRKTHARRHGRIYTQEQVRDFYSKDGNQINCKCSQRSVLVDEDGQPLPSSKRVIDRMSEQRQEFDEEE